MKLLSKLVILGIVSVGLAMGSTGYFVISDINKGMSLRLSNRLAGDTRFAAARIIDKRDQIGAITQIVAQAREIRKALVLFENRGVSQILNDQIAVYPFINYILVTELDGTVFAASTGDGNRQRLNGEQLLSKQVKDNPMYAFDSEGDDNALLMGSVGIDPYLDIIGLEKEYSQWYSMDIQKKGETIGRVILSVDWSGIHTKLLDTIFEELIQTGNPIDSVFITELNGRVICSNSVIGDGPTHPSSVNENYILTDQKMIDKVALDLGVYNYTVIVSYDKYKALKPISDAKRFVMATTFIGSFFLGLMIFILIRKTILSRIDVLSEATKKIGVGNLDYQIEDLGVDEIADLGVAINAMVSNLGKKTTSIDQLNTEIDLKNQALVDLEEQKVIAEGSAKAKSEFLASMSHEIRTPMNGVLGMLGLIENTQLNERQAQQVNLAQTSAHSLLSIINDILDFSKIEAGKLDLEEIDFNLQVLLEDFTKAQALRASDKGLELIVDTRKIIHPNVRGDPGRLRQILNNLVGNALKFTSEGEILISGALEKNDASEIIFTCSVKDTGIGIASDKQVLLFDAFTQADASTTRKFGGTGLGLSITKQLCEMMDGKIQIRSELDKGSIFEFSVVLKEGKEVKNEHPMIDIGKLKILIVDDNKTNREVLKGQLAQWGVIVDEAPSALKALEVLNNNTNTLFDIALLDMEMPNMDGAELGKVIRDDRNLDTLKLVMMSSISHRGDRKFFSDIGFQAYFPKPLSASDLKVALSIVSGFSYEKGSIDNKEIVTTHYLREVGDKSGSDNVPLSTNTGLFRGCSLLLVEDNMINQEVAKGILEDFGFQTTIANNGREALQTLNIRDAETPFNIILMDCQMPIMDGYETTQAIRDGLVGKYNQDIPIVAMTANAMKGDKDKCIAAGMTDYVSKPIDLDDLKKVFYSTLKSVNANIKDVNNLQEPAKKHVWNRERYYTVMKNADRAEKIISMYLGSVLSELECLESYVINRDVNGVSEVAHRLKGTTANLYGEQLVGYLSKLEQESNQGKTSSFDELMIEINISSKLFLTQLEGR